MVWNDFNGKPDKWDEELKQYGAVTQSCLYLKLLNHTQNGERINFDIKVMTVFQSESWYRHDIEKNLLDYVLLHEQGHYDIWLTAGEEFQREISKRDYSVNNYNKEIEGIFNAIVAKYKAIQHSYDSAVSENGINPEAQQIWNMRIKKCLETNSSAFYTSNAEALKSLSWPGQTVKRSAKETPRQFAIKCRPLYADMPEEFATKIIGTTEWGADSGYITFYSQKNKSSASDEPIQKERKYLLGYIYLPLGKDNYKRVFIDTFYNDDKPFKISSVFFANADTDKTKELIIITNKTVYEQNRLVGNFYSTTVYNNITPEMLPYIGKLRKMDEISKKLEGGFEGAINGKAREAKIKTQKEVVEELKRLGY